MDVLVLGDFYTTDRAPEPAVRSSVRAVPAAEEKARETALTARAASSS
jgi:hypothetical protein